jgi:hypothetical protein
VNVNHLTVDIVKSYARACRDLYYYVEVLRAEGYDLLVVPSRGAYPFLNAVRGYSCELLSTTDLDRTFLRAGRLEELYLPFTADISPDQTIAPSSIRRYWAHVLRAILDGDKSDVAYRFYQFVRSLTKGFPLQTTEARGGKEGKFIFVDTVLSGRAICEIVQGFDAYGLTKCHFLLLLDNGGNDLKPEYRQKLVELEAADRATLIKVERIFTEDEGPAMSGIWTVTMPELMDAAAAMVPNFARAGETGAALAYCEVRKREDGSNVDVTLSNAKLSALLYSAELGRDDATARLLEDFQEHINDSDLQNKDYTKSVADSVVYRNIDALTETKVSGSHAVRAYFGAERARDCVNNFLRS